MLTFLNPMLLVGLLAAGIPLLLHLSRSRRARTIPFSTTRFFTEKFLRTYRMSRWTEWLVMAARMALCALLAVALARPLWGARGGASSRGSGSRSIAIVLDDSASMSYLVAGRSSFDRAKGVAGEILGSLQPGDSATIVLAGRRAAGPDVLFAPPTNSASDALAALEGRKVSALATDLSAAIAKAREIVSATVAARREVVVLSDLQENAWSSVADAGNPAGEVAIIVASIRPERPSNVAITALQLAASRPLVGVPFAIRPMLNARGDGSSGSVVARLVVDDRIVSERTVERGGDGRWIAPRFHHVFPSAGWRSGRVEIASDAMPADDVRHFAVNVLATLPILAIDGAPSRVASRDELFFFRAALGASEDGRGPFRLDAIAPDAFMGRDLSAYPLVVLANVASLTPPAVEKLESFVDRGGRLLIFPGDKLDPAAFNRLFASPERLRGGLAPASVGKVVGDPASPKPKLAVARIDGEHPALAAFADGRTGDVGGVTLRAAWSLDAGSSRVLMWADAGSPLLVEKLFGRGRVLMTAFPIDRDWTDFPVSPSFLPWVHNLVGYAAGSSTERSGFFATGDRVPLAMSSTDGSTRVVTRPDGKTVPAESGDESAAPLGFTDTARPGAYASFDPKRPEARDLFAVNLDGRESDLTYIDDRLADEGQGGTRVERVAAGLRDLLPGHPPVTFVDDPAKVAAAALESRASVPLWDGVLWIALLVALVEPLVANRISLKRLGGTRPPAEIALPTLTRSASTESPREVAAR